MRTFITGETIRTTILATACAATMTLGSCGPSMPRAPGPVSQQETSTQPTPDANDASATSTDDDNHASPIDWGDYALLLSRVSANGNVDRKALFKSRSLIDRMLARLETTGPASQPSQYPTPASRTTFYLNAANLAVLSEMCDAVQTRTATHWRLSPASARRFRIDGMQHTVFSLRSKAIESAGRDWRARFALFSGRAEGPLLWHRVLLSGMLDVQLDEIIRMAMKSPRVVRPDFGEFKRLLVCRELFEIREALVADYERRMGTTGASLINAILEWMDDFDRQTINAAIGYPVEVLPEDWTLPAVPK